MGETFRNALAEGLARSLVQIPATFLGSGIETMFKPGGSGWEAMMPNSEVAAYRAQQEADLAAALGQVAAGQQGIVESRGRVAESAAQTARITALTPGERLQQEATLASTQATTATELGRPADMLAGRAIQREEGADLAGYRKAGVGLDYMRLEQEAKDRELAQARAGRGGPRQPTAADLAKQLIQDQKALILAKAGIKSKQVVSIPRGDGTYDIIDTAVLTDGEAAAFVQELTRLQEFNLQRYEGLMGPEGATVGAGYRESLKLPAAPPPGVTLTPLGTGKKPLPAKVPPDLTKYTAAQQRALATFRNAQNQEFRLTLSEFDASPFFSVPPASKEILRKAKEEVVAARAAALKVRVSPDELL